MSTRKLYPGQMNPSNEKGKVRILSVIEDKDMIVCEVTNRISAFDVVLPPEIPGKGAVLNLIAAQGMRATKDICPNCLIGVPHARVSLWKKATPFKIEMVIRGYLVGHAWREYKEGKRMICGVPMPEGMVENQKFPEPIITPTTKAEKGHDEDISKEEIISLGLASKEDYEQIEKYTYALFQRGTEIAEKNGLILVDTKYEFGKDKNGTIMLIDEVHTPDSSRYFYKDGYEEKFAKGEPQRELSKEFVRKWLMEQGFQGRPGDVMPEFSEEFIKSISDRYKELYCKMGLSLIALPEDDYSDLYESVCTFLSTIHD